MRLREAFVERYGKPPRIFWAPGRVNLIGEHTDYNGGFVMPAAIDLGTYAAAASRNDGRLRLASLDLPGELDAPAGELRPRGDWTDYPAGVAKLLGVPDGADVLYGSTVPLGAGLSSSAAIAVASALAFGGARLEKMELARLCQKAENEFAGMRCGIMDPFASAMGQAGAALWLDCRSLEFQVVPIPPTVRLVIANSMVRHSLAAGEYNARRAACESAAAKLGVVSLRDAAVSAIDAAGLTEDERACARHVVTENARVAAFAQALQSGELARAGEAMYASHTSLRDSFRVSCRELNTMVELARSIPGVFGARLTGGGFGGCTVNLVEAGRADAIVDALREGYGQAGGMVPGIYVCKPSAGASEVTV